MKVAGCPLILLVMLAAPVPAVAGPATHLDVIVTIFYPVCPNPCPPIIRAPAGSVLPVLVTALDPAGGFDTDYTGTITLTSSDPLATLPASYTFTAADAGQHYFASPTALRTLGAQTVSATDVANRAVTGSWTVVIFGSSVGIAALDGRGLLALVALIAAAGAFLLRARA